MFIYQQYTSRNPIAKTNRKHTKSACPINSHAQERSTA